jgi:methylated-DNA-[protein]-cysteine S-methyltransferase
MTMTMTMTKSRHTVFYTELGWLGATVSPQGILRLVFDQPTPGAAWRALGVPPTSRPDEDSLLMDLEARLCRFAQGDPADLADLPIDWSDLTRFQVRVLEACRRIAWGQTRSYSQLAQEAGSPRAARAVGGVMSRNRVPLIIPCHRVVGSGGALGGFSSRSGLRMKRRLLRMEGGDAWGPDGLGRRRRRRLFAI